GRVLRQAGVEAVLAVPLRVDDEPIGLLLADPGPHRLDASERALLTGPPAQLPRAGPNARPPEQAKGRGAPPPPPPGARRKAAAQLGALYEISRSFTQSVSLETTLRAVATTVVAVLDVDAAVIRMPDERGERMVARAVHVAHERLSAPIRTVLELPQPRGAPL